MTIPSIRYRKEFGMKDRVKVDEDGDLVREFTIELKGRSQEEIDKDIAEMLKRVDFGDEDD